MTEHDILNLVRNDEWMMDTLKNARSLELPDWMIGAGFVRNKVWNHLHGYKNKEALTADIDLIYFDPNNVNEKVDVELSKEVGEKTGTVWEIVNQVYTHKWHNREPYKNTEDALADWVETATCVAVSITSDEKLKLHAPIGIGDLTNLIVRKNKKCSNSKSYSKRVASKKWKERWPKLLFLDLD